MKFDPEKAKKALEEGIKKAKLSDVKEAVEKQEEIVEKFKFFLSEYLTDAKEMLLMLKDYLSGEYTEVPWFTVAAITVALLYVLNPMDLIPDFIPVIGQIDDAMVMGLCLQMVRKDLEKYREWRRKRDEKDNRPHNEGGSA
ncbi:protein of unknown function DUF1232 [Thermovibrio ammonificans HB-1]|uniref:DUF1232 domain-containing protein n=1 Tax=Thermovibrio ammonificans (strain DSM 15698 / JCM 12110 / HB-1) TaxID=648996 RepID=E8T5T4_THEA1|nr:YkvA family protein [Thermovibrio ammonificans]ADU97660.1 protein of unknown function DUF1232 [Thermovibrio ammonificans HB-1]